VGLKTFSRVPAPPPFGRRDTFLRGKILHAQRCAHSMRGARLLVPSSSKLPPQFRSLVETTGFEAICALLKRSEDAVEVCFV